MHLKIFKKIAAPRRRLVPLLSVVISFAVSSALSCMEEECDKERQVSRELKVYDYKPLPEVEVLSKLLENVDPAPVAAAVSKVLDYLRYIRFPDKRGIIKDKIREWEDFKSNFSIENDTEVEAYLLNSAWKVFQTAILNTYMKNLLEKTRGLQKIIEDFKEHDKLQKEQITQLLYAYQQILEENKKFIPQKEVAFIPKKEKYSHQTDNASSKQKEKFKKILADKEQLRLEQERVITKQKKKIQKLEREKYIQYALYVPVCVVVAGVSVMVTLWRCSQKL